MAENKTETKIQMLTIKEAAALVNGLTEYRVRELCKFLNANAANVQYDFGSYLPNYIEVSFYI